MLLVGKKLDPQPRPHVARGSGVSRSRRHGHATDTAITTRR